MTWRMDLADLPDLPADVAAVWDDDMAGAADRLFESGARGLLQILPGMVVAFRNTDVRALASDPAVGNVEADLLAQMMSFIGYDDPERGFVPVISNQVFAFDPPLHAPARRALTRQMTPSNVERFGELADRLLVKILGDLDDGRPFDLCADLAQRFAAEFFGALVGLEPDEVVEAQRLTEDMGLVFLNAPTPDQVERVSAAAERYVELVAAAAERTLAGESAEADPLALQVLGDFAADLAAITEPGVPATAGLFAAGNFFDGFHTAGVGAANAVVALIERPGVAERVRTRSATPRSPPPRTTRRRGWRRRSSSPTTTSSPTRRSRRPTRPTRSRSPRARSSRSTGARRTATPTRSTTPPRSTSDGPMTDCSPSGGVRTSAPAGASRGSSAPR
jgi:cytochrome P450